MNLVPYILLADDDSGYKFVGIVIVAIIWGLGALGSMMKKANEQAKKQAAARLPRPAAAPARTSTSTPVPQRRPAQLFQPAQRAAVPQRRKLTPTPARPVGGTLASMAQRAAALVRPQTAAILAQRQVQAPQSAPTAPAASAYTTAALSAPSEPMAVWVKMTPQSAKATALRRWLRPTTLRKQFMITELLQPPMALRPMRVD